MRKTAPWLYVVVAVFMGAVFLRGCSDTSGSQAVTYTDECRVTYSDGSQSGMEDCDDAENTASNTAGASVLQLIQYPGGVGKWVAPTGDWG